MEKIKVLIEVEIYPGEEQETLDIITSEMMRECRLVEQPKCTGKPYTKIKGVAYVKDPIIERSKKCYGN